MKNGKFPKKWRTIDIFPEMKLYRGKRKIKIWLRKNRHKNRKQSNYLLEAEVDANTPKEALDFLGNRIETIIDMLTFQLQAAIPITYVEVVDLTAPLRVAEERDWLFSNSDPRVRKDSIFRFMAKWMTSIDPKLIQRRLDANVEEALRWFSKGMTPEPIIDQFTSFWIALEILTSPTKPRKKVFFQCRKCGYEINSCPKCSYSTLHFPDTKERIESFVTEELGIDKTVFEGLWNTRMIFHGRIKLTQKELTKLADMTWELRVILAKAFKRKLGLDQKDKPYLIGLNMLMMEPFIIQGHRKLTELDLGYAKSR